MRIIDCSTDAHLPRTRQIPLCGSEQMANVAAEHTLNVLINERLAMRLTCTPEHLDELVLGRLLTEGLAATAEDIQEIYICDQGLRAKVLLSDEAAARLSWTAPETVGTCCTDNRTLIGGAAEEAGVLTPIPWETEWLRAIPAQLQKEQSLYEETRAAHGCCLLRKGKLLCCREDIGRHNALDKAVGWAVKNGVELSQCMLFTTGRLPADMVSKAIRAGVPLLASKTFPTDRGAALARGHGLTLITVRLGGQALVWSDGKEASD